MDNLQKFFDGITKELNSMVRWQDDAPVAEFWELFDLAIRDVATMRAENAELRARLDAQGQHPGFPQPPAGSDPDEPVPGTG